MINTDSGAARAATAAIVADSLWQRLSRGHESQQVFGIVARGNIR